MDGITGADGRPVVLVAGATGYLGSHIGDGEARINSVHPADLGDAVVRLVTGAASGGREVDARWMLAGLTSSPITRSPNQIAALAFHTLGARPHISHIPVGLVDGASALIRPFNSVAAGFLRFFSAVMTTAMVAPLMGTRRLADEFADQAARGVLAAR